MKIEDLVGKLLKVHFRGSKFIDHQTLLAFDRQLQMVCLQKQPTKNPYANLDDFKTGKNITNWSPRWYHLKDLASLGEYNPDEDRYGANMG